MHTNNILIEVLYLKVNLKSGSEALYEKDHRKGLWVKKSIVLALNFKTLCFIQNASSHIDKIFVNKQYLANLFCVCNDFHLQ